jgi:hypothetical protein
MSAAASYGRLSWPEVTVFAELVADFHATVGSDPSDLDLPIIVGAARLITFCRRSFPLR